MVKFSIIIPFLNTEEYIGRCVESILAQTNQDFEIICVNDGSTDNSVKVLEQYKDSITLINQENLGLSEARNNGVKVAKGKYILIMDPDDMFLNENLFKELYNYSSIFNLDIVVSYSSSINFN